MLVAELHGLLPRYALLGDVPGSVEFREAPDRSTQDEQGAVDAHARERVRAAVEDLGHRVKTISKELPGKSSAPRRPPACQRIPEAHWGPETRVIRTVDAGVPVG